jgi:hypothetical protein
VEGTGGGGFAGTAPAGTAPAEAAEGGSGLGLLSGGGFTSGAGFATTRPGRRGARRVGCFGMDALTKFSMTLLGLIPSAAGGAFAGGAFAGGAALMGASH